MFGAVVSNEVAIAFITVMGAIGVELIRTSRRAAKASQVAEKRAETAATRAAVAAVHADATAEAIGTPNGHGNVVVMLEKILAGQTGQDERLARLESFRYEDRERLKRLETLIEDKGGD